MAPRKQPDSVERERVIDEIYRQRRRLLEEVIETLVTDAVSYHEEKARDDNLHRARLKKRRYRLEQSIRLASRLMSDEPITDKDIERHQRFARAGETSEEA
jgi:hypothetical protein